MTKYKTILCDPPWNERGGGKIKRGADKHYSLMKTPQIRDLMATWLEDVVDDDAHMYLWVTNSFLQEGLWLMENLGFRYITNLVWVKDRIGIGRYFRGKHELCLFGVKGNGWNVRTASNSVTSVVTARKREHSRKPDSFYDIIESRSSGPYLELFSRASRPEWDAIGNQTGLFDTQNTNEQTGTVE